MLPPPTWLSATVTRPPDGPSRRCEAANSTETTATLLQAAPADASTESEAGIRLKLQLSLIALAGQSDESGAVVIEADKVEGNTEKEARAEGNVQLRRLGQAIYADRLRYDAEKQELDAAG